MNLASVFSSIFDTLSVGKGEFNLLNGLACFGWGRKGIRDEAIKHMEGPKRIWGRVIDLLNAVWMTCVYMNRTGPLSNASHFWLVTCAGWSQWAVAAAGVSWVSTPSAQREGEPRPVSPLTSDKSLSGFDQCFFFNLFVYYVSKMFNPIS